MKKILIFLVLILAVLFSPKVVLAEEKNQFVTIVNPVRISLYNKTPKESLNSEYRIVDSLGLPATWLLTYDVLERPDLVSILKNINSDQELGIFLEVTDNFAQKAGVKYNQTGFWHHANSLFLSGYQQEAKNKLKNLGVKYIYLVRFEDYKEEIPYSPGDLGIEKIFENANAQIWIVK